MLDTASDTGPGAECVSEGRLELPANGPTREVKTTGCSWGSSGTNARVPIALSLHSTGRYPSRQEAYDHSTASRMLCQ